MKRLNTNNPASIKVAAFAVILAGLYFGKAILVPIALASLLSLFLRPAVNVLERYIGRVGAVIASVAISMVLLGGATFGMGAKIAGMASNIPIYKVRIEGKLAALNRSTNKWVGVALTVINELNNDIGNKTATTNANVVDVSPVRQESPSSRVSVMDLVTALLGPLVAPLEMALIVLIFTIFILIQRDDLRNRIVCLVGTRKMSATSQAFDEAGDKLSHYLLMQSVINFVYGIVIACGLYALGVSDGIVWGMLAAILRFVPYIGTWIAALPPFFILLATTDGWQPAYVLFLFLALDVTFPTAIEPLVIGGGVGISPLSLLVAAIFWTWLWGFIGLLLSTPLTVCLAVMGKHVLQLRFLNVLLTDKPVLDAKSRFYQRLLSKNTTAALDVANAELRTKSLAQIYDELLVPVLSFAERDLHAGRIDEAKARRVRAAILDWASKQSHPPGSPAGVLDAKTEPEHQFSEMDLKYLPEGAILCIPAQTEADEVSAQLFAAVLKTKGLPAVVISVDQLAGEVLRSISEWQTGIVCICALPPFATAHSRYLFKRIRTLFPAMVIVVGLWNRKMEPEKSRRKLMCAPADGVATNFSSAIAYINQHVATLILKYRNAPPAASFQTKQVAAEFEQSNVRVLPHR